MGGGRHAREHEQFVQQDQAEEDLFLTEEAARPADYSLSDRGTLEDLYGAIGGLSTP